MNEMKHEQARYYLHIGKEHLSAGEQGSLDRHLAECGDCKSYATELGTLQSTVSRVMHAQWDTLAPSPVTDKKIQTRIRRNIVQNRALNWTGSLASGAVLLAFIVVIAWFFRPPPPVLVNPGSVSVPTRVNRTFGNTITLLGFGLTQDPLTAGSTVNLTLFWQSRVVPQTSYAVFIHLQDENDRLLVQSDALPLNGTRPTTSWKPDEVIEDSREIKLPGTLPPGQYKITVGLYDPKTGARLTTSDGKDALTLATLTIASRSVLASPSPSAAAASGALTPELAAQQDVARISRGNASSFKVIGKRPWQRGVVILYTYSTPAQGQDPAFESYGYSVVEQDANGTWRATRTGSGGSSAPFSGSNLVEALSGTGSPDSNTFSIVAGLAVSSRVASVEATFDNGQILRDQTEDGVFALLAPTEAVCELQVLDPNGHVLQRIDLAPRDWPGHAPVNCPPGGTSGP